MNIGATREKQKDYPKAVKAYERAADRIPTRRRVASDAMYKAGDAYLKEAKTRTTINLSRQSHRHVPRFLDVASDDERITEAQKKIEGLRTEQARGSFETAKFYEKRKKWEGAKIYYNDARNRDPGSPYAEQALVRIEQLNKRTETK
jgi:outer membrane protein assembly factor BamD (BamD/ComL family)